MNDAYRAAIVDVLNNGATTDDICAQLPDVTVGEIAAIAETEGLTQARRNAGSSTAQDADPQLALALTALAWGENSHTARIRNLAARTRAGLTELQEMKRDASAIEAAEKEVAEATQSLTKAQAKLRRLKNAGKATKPAASASGQSLDDKRRRDELRSWARAQGMAVSQVGSISKDVMDAWNNRYGKPAIPAQREAGLPNGRHTRRRGRRPAAHRYGAVTLLRTGGGAGFGAYALLCTTRPGPGGGVEAIVAAARPG
ncbi:histone-like nucleoid-structuring protein Lsr2 [Streptomyces sp. NPDC046237]|uniref:Lsr2 family DNA-binding protein n=1 Tax=Streptomyces sp. NPDC046237 TaxID=3154914 RepID=UPI0033D1788D